jgi:hypothetical protein
MTYPIYPPGREGALYWLCDRLFELLDKKDRYMTVKDNGVFYHGNLEVDPATNEFIIVEESIDYEGNKVKTVYTIYVERIIYGPDAGNFIEVKNG